jgi:hypothetical protein
VQVIHYFVCFLLGDSPASEFYKPTFRNTICSIFIGKILPMNMEQIECSETSAYKIRRRGITQKKTYNIQNTAKV